MITVTDTTETAERTAAFKARIDAGEQVEATDWMPEEYRTLACKFIEMHANSEIMGALPEGEWIPRAPSLRRKLSLTAKVQDEVGHGHMLYRVAEDLGKPREQMIDDLLAGRSKFHNVFHYPAKSWGDVGVIGFLVDGAALVTQKALLQSSYAPYVRVLKRIVAEESLHQRHGEDLVLELCAGTDEQRAMFSDAVNRWWAPVMHFFGPPSDPAKDRLMYWGFKPKSNEELRQEFFTRYVPKMWDLGIRIPDDELAYDHETGAWTWGDPGWDEFWEVVRGSGPMTQARLEMRRTIHESHAWLHEVLDADAAPCLNAA
jgi:ring-1,2-phenylacetyl-CoA epoxidase subunit PaaA